MSNFMSIGVLPLTLSLVVGCVPAIDHQAIKPFESAGVDSCLTVVVDMSGSFAGEWQERAYPLLLDLMDQFFEDSRGGESRIILAQLSGKADVILFQGRPEELRLSFESPAELGHFLAERSDPKSSPVYRATDRAVRYVMSLTGVTEQTRLMTVVLSDLEESQLDLASRERDGRRMLATFKKYQQMGGGLAFYYVAPEETNRWSHILQHAGFEQGTYVIESSLVAKPQLPRFQ